MANRYPLIVDTTIKELASGDTLVADNLTLSGTTPTLTISATGVMNIPTGTTAQRPGSATVGSFRYNTTDGSFEGYSASGWGEIGGGGANLTTNNYTGDGSTAFTLGIDPSVEQNTFVYIDGVYQFKNTYSTSGTTLTFSTAPPTGALVEVMSMTATNSVVGTVSDNAITTAKILDLNVTTAKIANLNVTTGKIANDAVNSDKLDGSLTIDINGGTIDGAVIGGSSAAAGTFTTVTDGDGALRAIPQSGSDKTSAYTLVAGDVGNFIGVGASGAITIPNSVFSAGDAISIFNNTTGDITITCTITTAYKAGTNADIATATLATRGVATILFISGTVCVIAGNI
jgi:hypothetical protein